MKAGNIFSIVILIALSMAVGYFLFSEKPEPIVKTETVIEYRYDTIRDTVTNYQPVIRYQDTGSYHVKWKYKDVDTNQILREYFTRNFYIDTISKDSSYIAIIKDSVFRNQITWRHFSIEQFQKEKIITNTVTKIPQQSVFLGLGTGKFMDKVGLTGSLSYQRSDMLYKVNYDVINNNFTISASYKLWQR